MSLNKEAVSEKEPVVYDPQYILMVNYVKKYFTIKGGIM